MPRYRVDFHGHCQGDPMDQLPHTAFQYVDRAVEQRLNAIAITWHRKQFDMADAVDYARERGILLIPGIETELNGTCHTLVLNAPPGAVGPFSTVEDLRRLRQNPSILVIAPHPYYPLRNCLGRHIDEHPELFDAVEWCHLHAPFLPKAISPNEMARAWANRHGKALIACSDAHTLDMVGCNASEVEADELTTEAIFKGIRDGHVTFEEKAFSFNHLALAVWGVICDPPWARRWTHPSDASPTATSPAPADAGVPASPGHSPNRADPRVAAPPTGL
ncbi:hypothetical protein DB346_06505 [Verrucomicrobia bacterium LW23]|nr:hypothetical protein DB346_06505 [Verrucomicrobia bacterium LW23]